MNSTGVGQLHVSANGVDYEGKGFSFEFTDPADIYRIAPQSGPKDQASNVKIIGGGLKSNSKLYAKLGNYHLEPIEKEQVQLASWNLDQYLDSMLMTQTDLTTFKAVQHTLVEKEPV